MDKNQKEFLTNAYEQYAHLNSYIFRDAVKFTRFMDSLNEAIPVDKKFYEAIRKADDNMHASIQLSEEDRNFLNELSVKEFLQLEKDFNANKVSYLSDGSFSIRERELEISQKSIQKRASMVASQIMIEREYEAREEIAMQFEDAYNKMKRSIDSIIHNTLTSLKSKEF